MSEGLGRLEPDGDRAVLRFERLYDATPDEVWSALTERESIRRWLLADAVLEPRVGGAFRLAWSEDERTAGSVLAWEPPRLLEVEWNQEDAPSVLRVEISASASGAVLVLHHRRVALDSAVSMGAGWHSHLDALGEVLEGRDDTIADRWRRRYESLRPEYEALMARL